MKLKYKFFIAFIITSFLILTLVVGVTQINIRKNFIEFVNNTEFENLTKMMGMLQESYEKNNGWEEFYSNRIAWNDLLFQARPDNKRDGNFHSAPPGPRKREKEKSLLNSMSPPGQPMPMDPFSLHLRLCLFDVNKQCIAGDYQPGDKFNYRPIILSGQTIGWLGLKNQPAMIKPLELEFLKKQTYSFYIIGAGIFILAMLISYIMSKNLLSPIQEIVKGTRAMRNFDFNTTIKVRSKDELGGLADDFNLMAKTLKQYEILRKNWLSDISHELRTPVSVIRSKIEALQDGIRVMTPMLLDSLHKDIMGLGNLVNDLHLISLADSKNLPVNWEQISPFGLIDQCIDTFLIRLEQHQIMIQTDWDKEQKLKIHGDAILLSRVFNNLFENSLRYTSSPGKIKIAHDIKENRLIIYFEDSSPGVPENALEYIFDRLYRVEQSRDRSLGGSGLGLSIARQIITKHDGTIKASPSSLGGLKLTIELPLYKNN